MARRHIGRIDLRQPHVHALIVPLAAYYRRIWLSLDAPIAEHVVVDEDGSALLPIGLRAIVRLGFCLFLFVLLLFVSLCYLGLARAREPTVDVGLSRDGCLVLCDEVGTGLLLAPAEHWYSLA